MLEKAHVKIYQHQEKKGISMNKTIVLSMEIAKSKNSCPIFYTPVFDKIANTTIIINFPAFFVILSPMYHEQ